MKLTQKKIFYVSALMSGIFLVLCLMLLVLVLRSDMNFQERGVITDGVFVESVPVGGLTEEQASQVVRNTIDRFEGVGVMFTLNDYSAILKSEQVSYAGPDYSYTIFEHDVDDAIKRAKLIGRRGILLERWYDRYYAQRDTRALSLKATVNEELLLQFLKEQFAKHELKIQETGFGYTMDGENPRVSVISGVPGNIVNYAKAIQDAKARITTLQTTPIMLETSLRYPIFTDEHVRDLLPRISTLLSTPSITFEWDAHQFTVPRKDYAAWLKIGWSQQGQPTIVPDFDGLRTYFDSIAEQIEVPAQDAKFELAEGGKVRVFESSREGLALSREKSMQNFSDVFFDAGLTNIPLAIEVSIPAVSTETVNNFGIKEIIAEGRTKFTGSPKNRRANIARGIELINGTLVKPGDEFSALKSLAPIDVEHGFLAELVIKENETKPEAGGGLCQVSTTLFRAALNAGLPITARTNHSYRVPYYEPPVGKDATIYDGAPDFRFLNDTGNYILVRGRVEGDTAIFEFWGTKDLRTNVQTDPVVSDFVDPPAPKRIKTDSIPLGTVKCTERAHTGAKAYFDYIVTYADGRIAEKRFKSHYRPWGEVCLEGVTKEQLKEFEALQKLEGEKNVPIQQTTSTPI